VMFLCQTRFMYICIIYAAEPKNFNSEKKRKFRRECVGNLFMLRSHKREMENMYNIGI
jgi:hypothetical protein